MTILTFPSLGRDPSSANWGLSGHTQNQVSPFDGSVQSLTQPGSKWSGTINYPSLSNAAERTLGAFLASLNGMAGRFTFAPSWIRPVAALTAGTPLVNGGSQTGTSLITDGWTHSVMVARIGEYFSFLDAAGRTRLHRLLADVTADGSGNATLSIAPPLRSSPADNVALNVSTPAAVFMLADDSQGRWGFDGSRPDSAGGFRGQVSIDIVEALV